MVDGYHKIFVALDGTTSQDAIFTRALEIAARNKGSLVAGHVIDATLLDLVGTYPPELIPSFVDRFKESIVHLVDMAQQEPALTHFEVLVEVGRIKETLLNEFIVKQHPDLVVCGARGLSPLKHMLLGSVSSFLVAHTDCDILVVK